MSDPSHSVRSTNAYRCTGAGSGTAPGRSGMATITAGSRARGAAGSGRAAGSGGAAAPRSLRAHLARLDADQACLQRARQLLQQGRALSATEPRDAFELAHRAALRGAGVLVTRANRERRRPLPLNVWRALERIGGSAAERSAELTELVAERERLHRDPAAHPDPVLLERHLEQTARPLEQVADLLLEELPGPLRASPWTATPPLIPPPSCSSAASSGRPAISYTSQTCCSRSCRGR